MYVAVIEPPAAKALSLADAKAHLRVDHSDDDLMIESYLDAAIGHIDGPAAWLGRSLITQTLEARYDSFDSAGLRLMYDPVIAVSSVKYDDENGDEQTFDAANYRLSGPDGQRILGLKPNLSWPATYAAPDCVRVRYTAGYGGTDADVPAAIRQALLLMVGDFYRHRETVAAGTMNRIEISTPVEALLRPFRIYY